MPRKRTLAVGNEVNPLHRMLGTHLRLERIRLGKSSADIAKKLGLSDTYLRLAESGRAALNQSLVFKLIEEFADSNAPTHDSRTISFNRLCLFLVGAHWVGAEMASLDGAPDAAQRALDSLGKAVTDFQIFYERTKGYFESEDDSHEQKVFLEDVAAPEVGVFLRSEVYTHTTDESAGSAWHMGNLLNVPTLNIEILLDLKQALAGRSFVHTADIASAWESQRSSQFRSVRGVYKSSDMIVGEKNLECFHYDYLMERRFDNIQMIFLSGEHPGDLKNIFIKRLNQSRKRQRPPLPLLEKAQTDKILFLCPTAAQCRKYETELNHLRRKDAEAGERSPEQDAYWSFETHSGLQIGFVCIRDSDRNVSIRNLNLRDSLQNANCFRQVWDGLNATHKS